MESERPNSLTGAPSPAIRRACCLELFFGETSESPGVIGPGEARIEDDGDAVIVDGVVELSMRLPFIASR